MGHAGAGGGWYGGSNYQFNIGAFINTGDGRFAGTMEIQKPYVAEHVNYQVNWNTQHPSNGVAWYSTSGMYDTNEQFGGLMLYGAGGQWNTANFKVYGYR